MSKQAIFQFDTVDDRKEIHALLHRLPPQKRLDFLKWCCTIANGKRAKGLKPQVKRQMESYVPLAMKSDAWDDRLTLEIFMDLFMMEMNFALDFDKVLAKLIEVVRA